MHLVHRQFSGKFYKCSPQLVLRQFSGKFFKCSPQLVLRQFTGRFYKCSPQLILRQFSDKFYKHSPQQVHTQCSGKFCKCSPQLVSLYRVPKSGQKLQLVLGQFHCISASIKYYTQVPSLNHYYMVVLYFLRILCCVLLFCNFSHSTSTPENI